MAGPWDIPQTSSLPFNTSHCCLPSISQQVSLHSPLFFGSTSLLLVLFGRGERHRVLPAVVWVQLFRFLLYLFWFVCVFFLVLFCCGLSSTSEQRTSELLCNRAGELCVTHLPEDIKETDARFPLYLFLSESVLKHPSKRFSSQPCFYLNSSVLQLRPEFHKPSKRSPVPSFGSRFPTPASKLNQQTQQPPLASPRFQLTIREQTTPVLSEHLAFLRSLNPLVQLTASSQTSTAISC